MDFSADSVEYWSQDGVETVFFGAEGKDLALTISSVPGTSDHYFEWNSQSNACTGAVKTIRLSGRSLRIQLLAKAARQLGTAKFAIELACDEQVLEEVTKRLSSIFGAKFEVTQASRPAKKAAPAPNQDYAKIKYLNLEGKNLKALPAHVRELGALEVAKLARNPQLDFREVCEVLGKLPSVKELSFTTDQPVPENIGALGQLESLSLDGFSKPQVLPESIGQLRNLKRLQIMSGADVILPESFAALTGLESLNIRAASWQAPTQFHKLSKLTSLDFENCRFTRVPELASMDAVTTVYFAGQGAREYSQLLPVVARMPNLKTLQLAGAVVPAEVALCQQIEELIVWGAKDVPASIGKLKNLTTLVLSSCDFRTPPESIGELSNLELLNISENPSLRALPESLGNLSRLRFLILEEDPLLTQLPDSLRRLTRVEEIRLSDPDRIAGIPDGWKVGSA